MFIIWGRKAVTRQLGFVADYCPICRAQRAFSVQRVGSAGHVYYISFGEGQLVGYQRTCRACGTAVTADPTGYASLSKTELALGELKRLTFPHLDEALRETMALEEQIKFAPHSLSLEERHVLIRSPFLLLSPKVEKRFSSWHIDAGVGIAILAGIALLFLGPVLMRIADIDAAIALLILFCLGFLLIVWQSVLSGGRYMRRHIIPVLAKNLARLQPRELELQAVTAELKRLGHKIGPKTQVDVLLAAIAADSGRPVSLAGAVEQA